MDKAKEVEFRITFPDPGLNEEQIAELEKALKSAVVTVLTERIERRIIVSPKVPCRIDEKTTD